MFLLCGSLSYIKNRISENFRNKTNNFVKEEDLLQLYLYGSFNRLSEMIKQDGDKYESTKDLLKHVLDDYFFDTTHAFMESSSVEIEQIDKNKIKDKVITVAKDILNNANSVKTINSCFSIYRETSEKYTYDAAYKIFKNKKLGKKRIALFAKTILLADDYCNINKLLKFRNILYSSEYLNDKYSSKFLFQNPPKNICSIFSSDYRLLDLIFEDYKEYKCIDIKDENVLEIYVLLLVYLRFILNMSIYLYELRAQDLEKKDGNTKSKNENDLNP